MYWSCHNGLNGVVTIACDKEVTPEKEKTFIWKQEMFETHTCVTCVSLNGILILPRLLGQGRVNRKLQYAAGPQAHLEMSV